MVSTVTAPVPVPVPMPVTAADLETLLGLVDRALAAATRAGAVSRSRHQDVEMVQVMNALDALRSRVMLLAPQDEG